MSEECMGYANYETWAVSLILNNIQGYYRTVSEWAEECSDSSKSISEAVSKLAKAIADLIHDEYYGAMKGMSPIAAQLFRKVEIGCIDYVSIAEEFIPEDHVFERC